MARLLSIILVVALIGCGPAPVQNNDKLFDVDSLINAQIEQLSALNAKAVKRVVVDNQPDTVEVSGKEAWQVELEMFRQMELINRPANRDLYEATTYIASEQRTTLIKPTGKAPALTITLNRDMQGSLIDLRGEYLNETSIFATRSLMYLGFHDVGGKRVLSQYSLAGGQRLLMGDSATFSLVADVVVRD